MPLDLQFVQAAVFTSDQPKLYDAFVGVFGATPTQLQEPQAQPGVALAVVDGRNLVVQSTPGRIDIFAAAVEQAGEDVLPGQFTPVPNPIAALDLIESAVIRLASSRKVVSRLGLILRRVAPAAGGEQAMASFAGYTGLPIDRVGTTENIVQANRPVVMSDIQGMVVNQTLRWQTEVIHTLDIKANPMLPSGGAAFSQRQHHAVSLIVDINVLSANGVVPLDSVSTVVHRLRAAASEMMALAVPGEERL